MDNELIRSLWLKGAHQFNSGEFFECHETLEKIWIDLEEGESKKFIQGIIHLAVGHYHHQKGNLIGGKLQHQKALKKLQGIDRNKINSMFNCNVEEISKELKKEESDDIYLVGRRIVNVDPLPISLST
ncbi:DUF309 domain-containing protein [bacterium]|nr:DUF309 domain-containing protein [bacterium]